MNYIRRFPDEPKTAEIVPIHKKGDKHLRETTNLYLYFLHFQKFLKNI